jgi:hypothetical protein
MGFAEHHGWDGVNAYLNMACISLKIKLNLASKVLPNPTKQVKRLGSVMACDPDDMGWLCLKYDRLVVSGRVRCKWMDNDAMTKLHRNAANFWAGIWFPNNARIDLTVYVRALLDAAARMGTMTGEGVRGGQGGRVRQVDNDNAGSHGRGGAPPQ